MTRGLNPPSTLSAEDVQTLRDVRRDIYYNGIVGGGLGVCGGFVLYTGAQWAKKLGFIQGKNLNRNTGMLTVLSSFAFGTFLASSTIGRKIVYLLHPVFQSGSFTDVYNGEENKSHVDDGGEGTKIDYNSLRMSGHYDGAPSRISYQQKILMSSTKSSNINNNSTSHETDSRFDYDSAKQFDAQKLREMRIARRKSLMDTLQTRGKGISDSHSGRWVEENSETKFEK